MTLPKKIRGGATNRTYMIEVNKLPQKIEILSPDIEEKEAVYSGKKILKGHTIVIPTILAEELHKKLGELLTERT